MLASNESPQENPLGKLLQSSPQKRCIQRVKDALPDILKARELGYTWDTIAQAMTMRRPTLINAFQTLLAQGNSQRTEDFISTTLTTPRLKYQSPAMITPQPSPTLATGIVALGRTDPQKFKI